MTRISKAAAATTLAIILAAGARHAWTDPEAPKPVADAQDTVAPGDLLCIGVTELFPDRAETLKTVRVNAAGEVGLYFTGVMKIGGLSYEDAAKKIGDDYKSKKITQSPAVTINRLAAGESRPLKPGDRVSIKLFELAGPGKWTYRIIPISPAGNVSLPYISPIRLAGLDERAAEELIARHYIDGKILRHAAVSVLRLNDNELTEPSIEPAAAQITGAPAR